MDEHTWGRAQCLSANMSFLLHRNFFCLLLCCLVTCTASTRLQYGTDTYEDLFRRGVDAYLSEKWHECVVDMLNALDERKFHREVLVHCRSTCKLEREKKADTTPPFVDENLENLQYYGQVLRESLCLLKCKKRRLGERPTKLVSRYVEEAFDSRLPYDYLQLCYYKIGKLEEAASSAYTFLTINPEHEVMRSNLQFYASQPDIDMNRVKNLQSERFQELYLMGNEAYNNKNYHDVMHFFENAVEEYYEAEENCRHLCEGPFDQNGFPDFTLSIGNHFAFVLKCKQKCADKLSFMYGEKYDNYLPSHYHYLQFAYFKVGETRKACQAVASYLLFHPNDTTMKHNLAFYSKEEGVTREDFTPAEEAVKYAKRDKYEKGLIKYIEDEYKFDDELEDNEKDSSLTGDNVLDLSEIGVNKRQLGETEIEQKHRLKKRAVDIVKWSQENGIQIVMDEKKLNGTMRFAADGFATEQQCHQLMELASKAAVHGDGYNGKLSPHTEYESFEGLTVGRAAMLVKLEKIDLHLAQLFINVSEKGRDYVEKYFNLNKELYFSYTHLVCRTALPVSTMDRNDLSHPVHADNCFLQPDGDCRRERPAYVWRDYSSILYLNDDFEGGEFFFAENLTTDQAKLKPKCGRLVGFSSGKENLHGVKPVYRGRRCALAMWYTLDKNHKERERDLAQHVLTQIKKLEHPSSLKPPPGKFQESKTLETAAAAAASSMCRDCDKTDETSTRKVIEKSSTQPADVQASTSNTANMNSQMTKSYVVDNDDDKEWIPVVTDKYSLHKYDGYKNDRHEF